MFLVPTCAQPSPLLPYAIAHLLQSITLYGHPKSMVYIRVHFKYCTFYGFGQTYTDIFTVVVSYRIVSLP